MRFRRWPRVSAYEDTQRKRAAFHRSQKQQREKLPLLAGLIAEGQHDVDTEMARRALWWPELQQEKRDRRARDWRRARARLAAHGGNMRAVLRQLCQECPYPADPSYLLDLLHQIDVGRIDPERAPWKYPRAITPRVTPNPATFDESFRQIGSRMVGGGPKATEADEFTFVGNIGSGLVFLISRVRLIEPHESFYTPPTCACATAMSAAPGIGSISRCAASARTRISFIGRLAQAADERPVVVRRAGQPPAGEAQP